LIRNNDIVTFRFFGTGTLVRGSTISTHSVAAIVPPATVVDGFNHSAASLNLLPPPDHSNKAPLT
jgi:hypothetical protein